MNSGDLDQEIIIQSNTPTRASSGQKTAVWGNLATDATVWANVKQKSGKEYMAGPHQASNADVVFTINHRTDITTGMRVRWPSTGSVYYDVSAQPRTIGANEWLEIPATLHRTA